MNYDLIVNDYISKRKNGNLTYKISMKLHTTIKAS